MQITELEATDRAYVKLAGPTRITWLDQDQLSTVEYTQGQTRFEPRRFEPPENFGEILSVAHQQLGEPDHLFEWDDGSRAVLWLESLNA